MPELSAKYKLPGFDVKWVKNGTSKFYINKQRPKLHDQFDGLKIDWPDAGGSVPADVHIHFFYVICGPAYIAWRQEIDKAERGK